MICGGLFANGPWKLLTMVHDVELTLASPGYELKIKHTPAPHPGPSFKFRALPRRRNGQR